jgi:hypothetical protein
VSKMSEKSSSVSSSPEAWKNQRTRNRISTSQHLNISTSQHLNVSTSQHLISQPQPDNTRPNSQGFNHSPEICISLFPNPSNVSLTILLPTSGSFKSASMATAFTPFPSPLPSPDAPLPSAPVPESLNLRNRLPCSIPILFRRSRYLHRSGRARELCLC